MISNCINGAGVVDHTGIRHEKAGNIRPVFVQIGSSRPRHNGAGNIAAPAGKGLYCTVGKSAVEAGNNCALMPCKSVRQNYLSFFRVESAVVKEFYNLGCVYKIVADKLCEYHTVQIFAAACRVVAARVILESAFYGLKLTCQIKIQSQIGDYGIEALLDKGKFLTEIVFLLGKAIAVIQHIGDLCVGA